MRVAQVIDIASVASTLAEAIRELGEQVDVLDAPRPGRSLPAAGRVLTAPVRLWWLLSLAPRLRAGDYDLVHAHYAWKSALAFSSRRPVIVHCHGSDVRGVRRGSAIGRCNEVVLRRADRVFYATPDLAPWVLPLRVDASFLPNPIDIERFAPPAGDEDPASRRDLLVGVRLDPVKGVESIVATVEALLRLRPSTTVTIVQQGSGVARVAAAAGPSGIMVLRAERAGLPALYRAHRIALGQSAVGAIGNYELEAMAAGLPVAADFRYPEAYDEPPPLLPAGEPERAAAEIARLLDDDAARVAAAARGRTWVAAHHGSLEVARRVLAEYRELLAGRIPDRGDADARSLGSRPRITSGRRRAS